MMHTSHCCDNDHNGLQPNPDYNQPFTDLNGELQDDNQCQIVPFFSCPEAIYLENPCLTTSTIMLAHNLSAQFILHLSSISCDEPFQIHLDQIEIQEINH